MAELASQVNVLARRYILSGHVQGVGFRPFVYRLAREHGLTGRVQNQLGQVEVVACGDHRALEHFEAELITRAPPLSRPHIESTEPADDAGFPDFSIASSSSDAEARIFVPQDFFMCDDCRAELHDPGDRRYRYPFINCTQCGPRYTLIESLPYDRPNTSMAGFPLCDACMAEYLEPSDRRFHAEPVACPECGPQLQFKDDAREQCADKALEAALHALNSGKIVAVKGIGGYHLLCDARSEAATAELRRRKRRPAKPLAVMFPIRGADGLDTVREHADLADVEAQLIVSPARPIVLVTKRPGSNLVATVAPGLAEIGVFLPYSPLHELLLETFDGPLVATSGNISGEPVLTDNDEVERRLADVADAYLHHDRPIVRPADDPVFRRIANVTRPIRVGRGCAPLELELPSQLDEPVLAVGGHMKGTVALAWDDRIVVSPHIGEMDSPRSLRVFEQVANDLQELYGVRAKQLVCDAHSGYTTHRWAQAQPIPVQQVWHHRAHASAVAAEFALPGRWLVFTWDGVGLGEDGTLWGGEALLGEPGDWRRVASLRTFRLPGGERAGREPWRSAAAMQWECGRDWGACPDPQGIAHAAWQKQINSPETSAAGRVFDAAAAMIIGKTHASFEAEGPMLIESLSASPALPIDLPNGKDSAGIWRGDWEPLLDVMGDDNENPAHRAEILHASMAQLVLQQARAVSAETPFDHIGLCGGVFQNRVLSEQVISCLQDGGFDVYLPEVLPCNDAALSYGQVAELAARKD